jgi:uncharacterized protein (TIGR02145 family)
MTDQQGNVYKTIVIGTQEWMSENLKTSIYRNGNAIANVTDNTLWGGLITGAWASYNNDSQYDCPFGKLYNWYAVADSRNLCPAGWHVPSDAEWSTLTDYLAGVTVAGGKMKTTGLQYWNNGGGSNNQSGFSGLGGGARAESGPFFGYRASGYWWSSSESGTDLAKVRSLSFYDAGVYGGSEYSRKGCSVRCLKDSSPQQGSINTIDCGNATNTGTLTQGISAASVSSSIPYTGGNGGTYTAQNVTSSGVTGLTATLVAGSFASGAGSLTYTITGTPASAGTASFTIGVGGQTCTLTRTVALPVGTITALSCSTATNTGTLTQGVAASSVSSIVPYTGGNGGTYTAQNVTSTGVTGLTATLTAGNFASGAGSLTYTITGTPSYSGTASFALSIGGQSCSLSRTIIISGQTGITAHSCGATNVHNTTKTYGSMTDQQGNVYKTIVIGNQEWMAENLKTSIYRNGQPITNVIDEDQWPVLTTGAWCKYNNDILNDCPFGKLYNWYAVADPRNLCPTGWHVPSDVELTTLTDFLGGETVAGGKMKSTGSQYWLGQNLTATNESGFSGLPSGIRDNGGTFRELGGYGFWWSSTELFQTPYPVSLYLISFSDNTNMEAVNKTYGFSVRCLKD